MVVLCLPRPRLIFKSRLTPMRDELDFAFRVIFGRALLKHLLGYDLFFSRVLVVAKQENMSQTIPGRLFGFGGISCIHETLKSMMSKCFWI